MMLRKKPPSPKSRSELRAGISHILPSFNQLGAFDAWQNFVANPKTPRKVNRNFFSLGNAVLDSTLVNLRALHDFSGPPNPKFPDGMHALQYGYTNTASPLLDKEAKWASNKRLAHLSWDRLEAYPGHFVYMYILAALDRMVPFLEFLRSQFLTSCDPEYAAVSKSLMELTAVRQRWPMEISRFNRNAP
jgi:hypothetical protein